MTGTIPIEGVHCTKLIRRVDERGYFVEIFRKNWLQDEFVQWNLLQNTSRSLRGLRVHPVHTDYVMTVSGRAFIALADLRKNLASFMTSWTTELNADQDSALVIPPGVAHGFLSLTETIQLVAVSHYWDPADELGCHWQDPELRIPWPVVEPLVSESDQLLPPIGQLLEQLEPFQPGFDQ